MSNGPEPRRGARPKGAGFVYARPWFDKLTMTNGHSSRVQELVKVDYAAAAVYGFVGDHHAVRALAE